MENITQWHLTFVGIENLSLRVLVLFLAVAALYFSWFGIKAIYQLQSDYCFLPLDLLRLCL